MFIDPPYVKTSANYISQKNRNIELDYRPEDTVELIGSLRSPIIFTYGTSAPETFPGYNWEVVKTVKVPNTRRGGTVERTEYVSYINF